MHFKIWESGYNEDSDSGGLGWDLRVCISNKFPGDASGLGPHFAEQESRLQLFSNLAYKKKKIPQDPG